MLSPKLVVFFGYTSAQLMSAWYWLKRNSNSVLCIRYNAYRPLHEQMTGFPCMCVYVYNACVCMHVFFIFSNIAIPLIKLIVVVFRETYFTYHDMFIK